MKQRDERARHYHLALTETERDYVVSTLRGSLHDDGKPRELADRIERARGEEDVLALAGSALRAWYYGRVRDLAADVLQEMVSGRLADTEELDRYLQESVDGTDIVVYTFKAKAALLASDNEDAAEDMGLEAPSAEARAYYALEADVRELLEAWATHGGPEGVDVPEGFEVGDASTWTPAAPVCSECGEPMFLGAGEVSHHGTDGEIDHDADADHVALQEVTP
jgi:hypothetical protein